MSKQKWFLVEGNIGSGKTTLLDKLGHNRSFEVIREPVDMWLKITGDTGENLLYEFYKNPKRYSYLFQTMVFKTRLESIDKPQLTQFRFSERSIWTDKYVFGKSCIASKKMDSLETNCYNFWFNWLEDKFFKKPDGIIYLRCSAEKCLERMRERGRAEENEVPLEYLKELENYHEDWITEWTDTPVLIIDNNLDNDWDVVINQISHFIK